MKNIKKKLGILMLLAAMPLSGCRPGNGDITTVKIANSQEIIDSAIATERISFKMFTVAERKIKDDDFDPLEITTSKSAPMRLPEPMEFGIKPNSAPEGYPIGFSGQSWMFYPGFTEGDELSSFSMTLNMPYKDSNEIETFSNFRDIVKVVSEEYGSPIYSQFTELRNIEHITGRNYLRLYDCGDFYVAHYATNESSQKYIANVLIFISKDYNHSTTNKIYSLIEGLENDIAQEGLRLEIKKEFVAWDGGYVEFSTTNPLVTDSTIDRNSTNAYIDSLFKQDGFTEDNKNLFLMLLPGQKLIEKPNNAKKD